MFLSRFQCSFYVRGTFPGENLRKIKFGASDMGIVNARRKVDGPEEILRGSQELRDFVNDNEIKILAGEKVEYPQKPKFINLNIIY